MRLDEPIFLQETIFTDAAGPQTASGVAWNLAMVRADLAEFSGLMESREDLRKALLRPFLNAAAKARLVDAVLSGMKAEPKAARFLSLLLRRGRLEILPSGSVWGDVKVKSLLIDEGGSFHGKSVSAGEGEEPAPIDGPLSNSQAS